MFEQKGICLQDIDLRVRYILWFGDQGGCSSPRASRSRELQPTLQRRRMKGIGYGRWLPGSAHLSEFNLLRPTSESVSQGSQTIELGYQICYQFLPGKGAGGAGAMNQPHKFHDYESVDYSGLSDFLDALTFVDGRWQVSKLLLFVKR